MLEKQFIKLFQAQFSNLRYGEERIEFIIEPAYKGYTPDLIVKAGKRNLAAVEFKAKFRIKNAVESFRNDYFFKFQIRYFVYTDGSQYFLFDRFVHPDKPFEFSSQETIERITTLISARRLRTIKGMVADFFIELASEFDNSLPGLAAMLRENRNKISKELRLSASYKLYFEGTKDDIDSFEQLFFRRLLNNKLDKKIYRYCSFSRAFQILNDNEIAMQGIPGMNDTTEPNYVDNYLNSSDEDVWDMSPESRATINRRFILSCTTLKDKLLPWRLYGDDGKGACIEFELKENLKDNSRFYLGAVKYANGRGKHSELEYLKSVIERIKGELNLDIRFVLMYVWRHFFKPHAYEYEQEVRLLYILRQKEREKKWLVADPYIIVNPFVVFKLIETGFPLKLNEVILGPKKSEAKLNVSQLSQMFSDKGLNCTAIESTVKVYR